jgi:AraC family transcriptional activator of pobA
VEYVRVLFSVINDNVSHCHNHSHPCWEIVYRISGNSNTVIGEKKHLISTGDMYIVAPGVVHSDTSDVTFSDLVVQVDFLDFSDTFVLHDDSDYILCISQKIHDIINKKEANYQNIANALAEALYQYIKRFSLSTNQNPLVQKLKNTIFENVENCDFNLCEEIKNMGYHIDYIRRCFKKETQTTPLLYMTELRIKRAKQLLVMPSCETIETIATKCGFQDSFYFSTCFKKHTGRSPRQWRKENYKK